MDLIHVLVPTKPLLIGRSYTEVHVITATKQVMFDVL